ncbi:MAG: right-handed parallel beta-helix repeat-containing protein [Cellulomonas sp.]
MKARALAATCVTAGLLLGGATAAHATGFGDCPGVVDRGHERYKLTADATCDLALLGTGAKVDLRGHTLSTTSVVEADDVSLRHGRLRSDGIYWNGSGGRLEDLDVTTLGVSPPNLFYIETGPDFTVTRSHFHDLPDSIALSFYFGGKASVTDSRFTRTQIGVSVQGNSDVTIARNRFTSNTVAVNLWNEDLGGVNNVTVTKNTITKTSGPGIRVTDTEADVPTFDNTRLSHNSITGSASSGIDVTVRCLDGLACPPGNRPIVIDRNDTSRNGFGATASTSRAAGTAVSPAAPGVGLTPHSAADRARGAAQRGVVSDQAPAATAKNGQGGGGVVVGEYTSSNDGITARAFASDDSEVPTPGLLAFVQVARNATTKNADRGIDAAGVTDGGGNSSRGNPNPCVGVTCRTAR